jgi:hypothetical protein
MLRMPPNSEKEQRKGRPEFVLSQVPKYKGPGTPTIVAELASGDLGHPPMRSSQLNMERSGTSNLDINVANHRGCRTSHVLLVP